MPRSGTRVSSCTSVVNANGSIDKHKQTSKSTEALRGTVKRSRSESTFVSMFAHTSTTARGSWCCRRETGPAAGCALRSRASDGCRANRAGLLGCADDVKRNDSVYVAAAAIWRALSRILNERKEREFETNEGGGRWLGGRDGHNAKDCIYLYLAP